MKRKIALISVIILCLAIVGSGTIAYFTAEDYAHNVITTNGIDIHIVEKTKGENGALVDFPKEGIHGGMPGTEVSKIVSVMNDGGDSAWIRVRVTHKVTGNDGSELPTTLNDGTPVMSYTVDSAKWMEKDGWYYYRLPVDADASTSTLFEEVHFAEWMGNEYQSSTMNLIVYAQAVQTDNNGSTVMDAKGWPEVNEK